MISSDYAISEISSLIPTLKSSEVAWGRGYTKKLISIQELNDHLYMLVGDTFL